ncbi:AbgT family transporter [Amycolatopsis samaneae]|uniref:AbgT family transporter n=1 Tax=Amycolatopsis samaneae TaxID=664691 RepID=A0ABW5GP72_9PSEU
MTQTADPQRGARGGLRQVLARAGAALPHPFLLFGYFFAALAVVSSVLGWCGTTVTVPGHPAPSPVRPMLSGAGVRYFLDNFVSNFIGFPPLGIVLVTLMAVGVAERTGFLRAAVLSGLRRVPARLMPVAVTLLAAQGHVMGDASMVVLPPLCALAFQAVGRKPVAGALGGFAAAAGGYAGGFLVGAFDANISSLTASVTPKTSGAVSSVTMNYFFQAASGLVLPIVTAYVLVRFIEPRLPAYDGGTEQPPGLSDVERRGLRRALAALGGYLVVVLASWLIPGGPLRGASDGLVSSPFTKNVVTFVALGFLLAGVVHGRATGTVRRAADVPAMMADSLRAMAGYVVVAFAAGQFIGMFTWTNLGELLSVRGAALITWAHAGGLTAFVALILLTFAFSLLISSGSALWTLMAPVVVPLFAGLNFHPALAQAAFRVGDSVAHPISPMNPYVYVLHDTVRRYDPGATVAGLFARLGVFVLPMLVAWTIVFAAFFAFGVPFGPGVPSP